MKYFLTILIVIFVLQMVLFFQISEGGTMTLKIGPAYFHFHRSPFELKHILLAISGFLIGIGVLIAFKPKY